MSKNTVYQGLKTAIAIRNIPVAKADDSSFTLLFESLEQFNPFDKFLDSIDTKDCKINIYAEQVNGHSDGVAVTVDDEIQHLGYMQSRLHMEEKIHEFEEFISKVLRTGANMHDYDYEFFTVEFDEFEYWVFNTEFKKNPQSFLTSDYYVSSGERSKIGSMKKFIFHFEFSD